MKAKMSNETFQQMLSYNWDVEDITDIVCGEFLFLYGEYDEVEVSEVTNEYVNFTFHNKYAGNITLQIDSQGHVKEVK